MQSYTGHEIIQTENCNNKEDGDANLPLGNIYKPGILVPGKVTLAYFNFLVDICVINNPYMVKALALVLVYGETRKEACFRCGVTTSYFSVKIRHLQRVSSLVKDAYLKKIWVK